MAATEHYSILMDLPLINDPVALRQGSAQDRLQQRTSRPASASSRGTVRATSIRWFEADPCYVYHSVNAWEEGDEIVLDLCRVTKPAPREGAVGPLAKMLSYLRLDAHMYRYRFNLTTGATTEGYLDDDNTEFPTMDVTRLGRPTRYAYNMRISTEPTLLFDGVVKYDTTTGATDRHWFGPGRWGSEAPFAPRSDRSRPGRGRRLPRELRARRGGPTAPRWWCSNAADLAAGPVARVLLGSGYPIGFHACWVRGDQLT